MFVLGALLGFGGPLGFGLGAGSGSGAGARPASIRVVACMVRMHLRNERVNAAAGFRGRRTTCKHKGGGMHGENAPSK